MVTPGLKRWLALLTAVLLMFCAAQAQAAFQAFVDRNPVVVDESFTLTLKSDENMDGDPELDVLKQDFDVLGQSKGSSVQIINGDATRSSQWQIVLIPKHSGQLTLPAIKAGSQTTQPIVLNVTAANAAQAAQQSGELFLEVGAEPHTAYVQQQIIFTVRLYRSVNFSNGSTLSDPKFPNMDAVVERLGEDRSYQTTLNGQAYAVLERRYLVYAQKSGQFTSSPVQFDGEIIEANRGSGIFMFDPFNQNTRHKRVNSKTITFSIKPPPAALAGAQWLPASKLQLAEQWSENPSRFTVGEPITRTLVITASGLTASQLPALDSQTLDGAKFYPDQPVLQNNKDDNGVSGVRTQKIAIMPTRAGTLTLPAIEIKWWNTRTDREEVARLPERNINVLPGSASPAVSADLASGEHSEPNAIPSETSSAHYAANSLRSGWPWLALFFAVGWLATLIMWWRQTHKKVSSMKTAISNQESRSQLEQQLQKSCLADDAAQVKARLLAWAKLRWPHHPPTSLTSLAGLCQPALAAALNELDQTLYAKNSGTWKGENLWQLFCKYKPTPATAQADQRDALEPLYKSN